MERNAEQASPAYQAFMRALCLYALGALAAQSVLDLEPETRGVLDYADLLACALFFSDFDVSLARAPDRLRYFLTWGSRRSRPSATAIVFQ